MNTPVLDNARLVQPGAWRVDVNASLPLAQESLTAEPEPEDTALSKKEQWRRLAFYPVGGIAAHQGGDVGQMDLFVGSNSMVGAGIKARLLDRDTLAIALGGRFYTTVFGFISEEIPAFMKLSVPLWIGFEPAAWASLYLTERVEFWAVEPVGVTGVAAQTVGFRLGGDLGVMGEVTYLWSPFHDVAGFQVGIALYFNLSNEPATETTDGSTSTTSATPTR